MPKLSVSVPDELWNAAKRRGGAMKTSELIQTALRLYVTGSRRAVDRSEEGDERFGQVLEGLVDEYKGERERGYAAGLRAAEIIGFSGLNKFAGSEENFERLFNSTFEDSEQTDYGWPSKDDYDDADSFREDEREMRVITYDLYSSPTFRAGALQAFNDLWMGLQAKIEDEAMDNLRRTADELGIDFDSLRLEPFPLPDEDEDA